MKLADDTNFLCGSTYSYFKAYSHGPGSLGSRQMTLGHCSGRTQTPFRSTSSDGQKQPVRSHRGGEFGIKHGLHDYIVTNVTGP